MKLKCVHGTSGCGCDWYSFKKGDYVVGMEVIADHGDILFATENGYGKRVKIKDFRVAHRGGVGVRTIPTDKRNGQVIGLEHVTDKSNVLLIDQAGKIIRLTTNRSSHHGPPSKRGSFDQT